jgi:Tfp pilus assembly protein PilO
MSLILLIVLLMLALRPTLITISNLLGQIKQQTEIAKQLDDKITQVQQAISEFNSISDKLELINGALPSTSDWNSLADSLNNLASSSGVSVLSVVVDKIPLAPDEILSGPGQSYKSQLPQGVLPVRFTVSAGGEYTQMRQFITSLESMRRVLLLTTVSIDVNKDGVLVLTVSGEAGYIPDQYL